MTVWGLHAQSEASSESHLASEQRYRHTPLHNTETLELQSIPKEQYRQKKKKRNGHHVAWFQPFPSLGVRLNRVSATFSSVTESSNGLLHTVETLQVIQVVLL